MAWRDTLRPASWRGVAFEVEGDEHKAGRRVQIHTYPLRDKPYAEDLGRAPRSYAITAFLIGDDYPERRDQLIAALERPGGGKLVHPFYGEIDVVPSEEARISHSKSEGGMCRVDLMFTEAGELAFPSRSTSTSDAVLSAADSAQTASIGAFAENFTVDGLPDFVSTAAVADLDTVAAQLDTIAKKAVAGDIAGLDVSGILDGEALGGSIWNSVAAVARDPLALITPTSFAGDTFAKFTQVADFSLPTVTLPQTPSRIQQALNTSAISALVRQASLVETARAAAVNAWPVFDDAVAVRDSLSARLIEAAADVASDTAFRGLENLRIDTVADITARATGAPRIVEVARSLGPTVVAAYELYEDATRADEIAVRNGLRHPAFTTGELLRVLTR